jgi:CspA family cold shock protein
MNFRDTWKTCESCGKKFIFTVEEQRRLHQLGKDDAEVTECPSCRQVDMEGVKLIGRVKWYNPDKGYGFIVKADGSEIFVHRSSLSGVSSLNEEQRVEFEERQTDKGPEAIDVAPLEG